MSYIEIDFEKVKGYSKLSDAAKRLFQIVYKKHNSAQGVEYKEDWKPVKVKEHRKYLEVHFKNRQWLHYTPKGTWY